MASLGKLSGHASFVDSTEMKKADVNYFIHVRVTNQRLVADNVTEFCPIDHIDPGQFTEIYGDCFISGFIEGGEFDAVISVSSRYIPRLADDVIDAKSLCIRVEAHA